MKIITGGSNQPFAQRVAEHCFTELVPADLNRFNDGEICVEIKENVRGKDVFLVNSTCMPVNESLMELLIIHREHNHNITSIFWNGFSAKHKRI